jgi:hypothetical protein
MRKFKGVIVDIFSGSGAVALGVWSVVYVHTPGAISGGVVGGRGPVAPGDVLYADVVGVACCVAGLVVIARGIRRIFRGS